MKTWIINWAHVDTDKLVAGVTTKEWIHASGDDEKPADATTFMGVVLTPKTGQLHIVRSHLDAELGKGSAIDVAALVGRTLAV